MLLSAVLIVKNEEKTLTRCLESIRGVVDEIVVVDTGSEDGTRDAAGRFTQQVDDFEWCDDFAAARNFALERATGEWVLSIDADEWMLEPAAARARLEAFTREHGEDVIGTFDIVNEMGADGQRSVFAAHRFFRRGRFHFLGAIHEQLVSVTEPGRAKDVAATGIRLGHSGYAQAADAADHKSHRNKRMLATELERHADDEYCWHQLGKAHFALGEFGEACAAFERAWGCVKFQAGLAPSGRLGGVTSSFLIDLIATRAYALVNAGAIERARDVLREAEAHPDPFLRAALAASPDFHYVKGYVLLQLGDLEASRAAFERALAAGPENEQVLGTGSYGALYHLGLLREGAGDIHGALEHYLKSMVANPSYRPVLSRCIDLAVEYRISLPSQVWELCDREVFAAMYAERVRSLVAGGDRDAAGLLLKVAQQLSWELVKKCVGSN